MKNALLTVVQLIVIDFLTFPVMADQQVLADRSNQFVQSDQQRLQLLRSGTMREWDLFSPDPQPSILTHTFERASVSGPVTLQLSQHNVKQRWQLDLNGKKVALLVRDENPMTLYWELDPQTLQVGKNYLEIRNIEKNSPTGDDILIGRIQLLDHPLKEVLHATRLSVDVFDVETLDLLPARLTVLNHQGELQSLGAESNGHLAVRPGCLFTSTGRGEFGLPAGNYTIYAGRGSEYSLAKQEMTLLPGEARHLRLGIERQVDTSGYVAVDTHVHTLTHSGHGDATVQERMVTIAAEGIELAIATDHNLQIDHAPFAEEMQVSQFFTPVIGNEYTTSMGHFNIFPGSLDRPLPDRRLTEWREIFAEMERTAMPKVVILNHARDRHSGFVPFGPENYLSLVGKFHNDSPIGFNAMEVINSGATQSDPMQLFQDWMNLLNTGRQITPVGSSDSHDVARHFVGQGRTYVRCPDQNPGNLDITAAVDSFLKGDVVVSYGIWTTLHIQESSTMPNQLDLAVDVWSPDWINPRKVVLFANGFEIATHRIAGDFLPEEKGHRWQTVISIPQPQHDTCFVALTLGDGVEGLYWRTALPYQPTSIDSTTYTLGCSGAKWFDANDDQQRTSPREYAEKIVRTTPGNLLQAITLLAQYDSAVAVHVAHQFRSSGTSVESLEFQAGLRSAIPHVIHGFETYLQDWKESEIARLSQ